MSVAFVDGPMVTEFVNDAEAFEKWVKEKFVALDADGDGVLSRDELQTRFGKLSSMEFELQSKDEINSIYDVLFEKYDVNRKGNFDSNEFRALAKEILLAKARGIGDSPVAIILQGDSLITRAVQRANSLLA